jgi:hypothetical protein
MGIVFRHPRGGRCRVAYGCHDDVDLLTSQPLRICRKAFVFLVNEGMVKINVAAFYISQIAHPLGEGPVHNHFPLQVGRVPQDANFPDFLCLLSKQGGGRCENRAQEDASSPGLPTVRFIIRLLQG